MRNGTDLLLLWQLEWLLSGNRGSIMCLTSSFYITIAFGHDPSLTMCLILPRLILFHMCTTNSVFSRALVEMPIACRILPESWFYGRCAGKAGKGDGCS
jgi:hypothetical protein